MRRPAASQLERGTVLTATTRRVAEGNLATLDTAQPATALTTPARAATASKLAVRLDAVDSYRGLAMLAVVLIHVTSATLGRMDDASGRWFAIAILNRSAQFAVPAFLFMTAFLAARSSLGPRWSLGRYYLGRLTGVLVPYLLWSGLYGLFRVAMGERDLASLADAQQWWDWLSGGKAYYHLYFLVIAMQFYAVFPLFRPLLRRQPPFWITLPVLAALQVGAYWLNRAVLHYPAPGTLALMHLLPLGLGMWAGAKLDAWPAFWRRWRWPVAFAGLVGWTWYLPLAIQALRNVPVDTLHYALSGWLYAGSLSLAVLALAWRLGGRRWAFLTLLGRYSLQVYLLHVAVIAALGKLQEFTSGSPLLSLLPLFALAVAVPLLVAIALSGTWLSRLLFGGR